MLNLFKSNKILLAFTSIALLESTTAFNCPSLNKDQISTVCLSTNAELFGVKAKEIEVDGVRFINHKNCDTFTSVAAKFKLGSETIEGTFVETARTPHKTPEGDFLEISGKCTYKVPKLLGRDQAIEFDVKAHQKVITGIRVSPLADKTNPKIGGEKVHNPEPHKPKSTLKEMVFGKHEGHEGAAETSQSPTYHQELKERQEGQAPRVVQHGKMPEPIMDYKSALPKTESPKPATKKELEMLERMQMYKEKGPTDLSRMPSAQSPTEPPRPERPAPLSKAQLEELPRHKTTEAQSSSIAPNRPQPPIPARRPLPQPPVMPGSEGSD